jgi:hypothetical protein
MEHGFITKVCREVLRQTFLNSGCLNLSPVFSRQGGIYSAAANRVKKRPSVRFLCLPEQSGISTIFCRCHGQEAERLTAESLLLIKMDEKEKINQ